jgi:hypothetical protein
VPRERSGDGIIGIWKRNYNAGRVVPESFRNFPEKAEMPFGRSRFDRQQMDFCPGWRERAEFFPCPERLAPLMPAIALFADFPGRFFRLLPKTWRHLPRTSWYYFGNRSHAFSGYPRSIAVFGMFREPFHFPVADDDL